MAVDLAESQPLGLHSRKPYWALGCERGAGDSGWIDSRGGAREGG